jgi:hypothetical protein
MKFKLLVGGVTSCKDHYGVFDLLRAADNVWRLSCGDVGVNERTSC